MDVVRIGLVLGTVAAISLFVGGASPAVTPVPAWPSEVIDLRRNLDSEQVELGSLQTNAHDIQVALFGLKLRLENLIADTDILANPSSAVTSLPCAKDGVLSGFSDVGRC